VFYNTFFSNNIIGGVIINNSINNQLFLFWNIGKFVYEKQKLYDNVIAKVSDFLSYYFGTSKFFTRQDIRYMKLFYLNFPIYYKDLEKIQWNQYKILLNVSDKEERYFYFRISILFNNNYSETLNLINNNLFLRV
jgi:hypothetical protein